MNFDKEYLETIKAWLLEQGLNMLLGVVLLIVGFWGIKRIVKVMEGLLVKKVSDPSLVSFIKSLISVLLKVFLIITVAGILGIETTSFIAVLGAAGLAIGLALKGTLSNFAGGVILLLFKPYKVGDLVRLQGSLGWVTSIQMFVTTLKTGDKRTIILPNGVVSNDTIVNYSTLGYFRLDLIVGISYKSDIKKAKEVLLKVMQENKRVLSEPAPFVGVDSLGDSSVNLAVRPHCVPKDFVLLEFELYEAAKLALDREGIEIPYPQLDLHMASQQ